MIKAGLTTAVEDQASFSNTLTALRRIWLYDTPPNCARLRRQRSSKSTGRNTQATLPLLQRQLNIQDSRCPMRYVICSDTLEFLDGRNNV